MPGHKKHKKHKRHRHDNKESMEGLSFKNNKEGLTINITIFEKCTFRNRIEQRAEGGGQINKNVGTNANQGGQNAINGSRSANIESQFANGNGRSGIAGRGNDEQGGQEAIKIRNKRLGR